MKKNYNIFTLSSYYSLKFYNVLTMNSNHAIKVRIHPNAKQEAFFLMNFGHCRFVYNKMLEERNTIYKKYKDDSQALRDYSYKTEKQLKKLHPFLKQADSNSLQQSRRNLKSAFKNFFDNLKERKEGLTTRRVGYPRFKSRKGRQSYSTCMTSNNIKVDWNQKLLKLPKLRQWVRFSDSRIVDVEIQKITISRNRNGHYHASILFRKDLYSLEPKQVITESKVVAFDMSARDFLVNETYRFSNPRFYRSVLKTLRKEHRTLSRRKKGSKNRAKAVLKLSRTYDAIRNKKADWCHKLTFQLSQQFEAVILEDLNIQGMQKFNGGLAKSVSLDFSGNQFITYLSYKCKRESSSRSCR